MNPSVITLIVYSAVLVFSGIVMGFILAALWMFHVATRNMNQIIAKADKEMGAILGEGENWKQGKPKDDDDETWLKKQLGE